MTGSDYYAILGIPSGATADQIERAYKLLVRMPHPDAFPNDPRAQAWADERMKQINEAYTVRDVFLSPAAPLTLTWQTAVEGFFLLVALFVLGYLLWEQRVVIALSLTLLFVVFLFTGWLVRPFGRAIQLWMPWVFLFRLIRRR